MAGKQILTSVVQGLDTQLACQYNNYVYPNTGGSYSNDDSDDSESEQ